MSFCGTDRRRPELCSHTLLNLFSSLKLFNMQLLFACNSYPYLKAQARLFCNHSWQTNLCNETKTKSLLSAFPSSEVIQIPSFATQDFPEPCWKCALPVISFRWFQPFKVNFQKAKVIDLFPILFLLMNPLKLWKLAAVCPILELPSYASPSRMTGAWDHAAQNGLRSCCFLEQRMSFNIYMPSGENTS